MFLIAILGAIELLLLLRLRSRVRETTLTAAWWWTVAATIGLTAAEVAIAAAGDGLGPGGAGSLRLIAAPLVFCPTMAVLGARRPQDRAWQFIVLSMWGVLALPGIEHLALQRGGAVTLHGVRAAFVMGLVALGLLNWLPTRRWPAAIGIAAAQLLLYGKHLPWIESWAGLNAAPMAAVSFVTGTAILAMQRSAAGKTASGLDHVWRDFRDDFGALWALRVLERVNAAASMQDWPVRLRWDGFHFSDTPSPTPAKLDTSNALKITLDNLLRRFVDGQWIAKRMEHGVH